MKRQDYVQIKYEINSFEKGYKGVYDFSEGVALVKESDGTYSYILPTGEKLFSETFCYARSFSDGVALVKKHIEDQYFTFINKEGETVLKLYHNHVGDFLNGHASVLMNDKASGKKLYGIMNKKGDIVVECKYLNMILGMGSAAVKHQNGKWGIIDKHGNTVLEFEYEHTNPFKNAIALVKKDGEEYYIDQKGKRLQVKNGKQKEEFHSGYKIEWKEDTLGFEDKDGNPLMIKERTLIESQSEIPMEAKNIEAEFFISIFSTPQQDIYVKDKNYRTYIQKLKQTEQYIDEIEAEHLREIIGKTYTL